MGVKGRHGNGGMAALLLCLPQCAAQQFCICRSVQLMIMSWKPRPAEAMVASFPTSGHVCRCVLFCGNEGPKIFDDSFGAHATEVRVNMLSRSLYSVQ